MGMLHLFLLIIFIKSMKAVDETCETPFGQKGRCTSLASCKTLLWSFAIPKFGVRSYLDKFLCSNGTHEGVYVCCEIADDILLFEDEEDIWEPDSRYILKELVNDENCGIQDSFMETNGIIGVYSFPWLVKLVMSKNTIEEPGRINNVACTGVLINRRYVLYTMQCQEIIEQEISYVSVRVDSYKGNNSQCNTVYSSYSDNCSTYELYEIEAIFTHIYYDAKTKINDLAIIRLESRVELSDFIKPICLPLLSDLPQYGKVYVSGWNRTFLPTDSSVKSTYTSIAISNSECKRAHKLENALTMFDICTVQGTLPNDKLIGYPVTLLHKDRWYLTGFTSRGTEPRINIRIQNYLQYIKETAHLEHCLTPFNETGECILLTECPRLRVVFANAILEEVNHLDGFVCQQARDAVINGKFDTLTVCCGYSSNFTIFANETVEKSSSFNLSNYDYCGLQHRDDYFSTNDQLSIDEFPWLAAIINATLPLQRDSICGGSLITERYVLTSTQCILSFRVEDAMLVSLGDYNIQKDVDCFEISELNALDCMEVQQIEVESKIIHPYYNTYQFINDIGLLRLNKSVKFSDYVRPICLPTSEDDYFRYGETFYTTGFGYNQINSVTSQMKKKILTTLISPDECRRKAFLIGYTNPKTDYEFCTEDFKNITDTTCFGDEGGPVMYSKKHKWFIQGISSTYSCSDDQPQTHLKVFKYLTWIQRVITH